jgi:hypothetical protein
VSNDCQTNRTRRRTRTALSVVRALLQILVLLMIGQLALQWSGAAAEVEAFMDVARPWLWAGHLALTALLWVRWSRVIHWLGARGHIPQRAVPHALRSRNRLVALILVAQLTLVMGLPFSLFTAAGGS